MEHIRKNRQMPNSLTSHLAVRMGGGRLWELTPSFSGGPHRDFPPFFGRQAFGSCATTLFAAKPPQFYSMRIFAWIRRTNRRIVILNLAGRDIYDPLRELVWVARPTWTLIGHAGNMA
jgi:hypothetical protein